MYSLLLAAASAAASVSAYTLANVTIGSTNPAIQYFPPCSEASSPSCNGAWWKVQDSRFLDGVAMTCGDPTKKFSAVEPFFHFTFTGTGLWMYQWMNASTATQMDFYDNNKNAFNNITNNFSDLLAQSVSAGGELVPVLTWSLTGLDPLKEHTVGLQHYTDPAKDTFITFDYMIVEQSTLDASEMANHKSKVGPIVGGVIGGIVAVIALILGTILYRNRRARLAAAKGGQRYNWQASAPPPMPGTLKFIDPSSEIEASEQIAREGRMEEELEKASSIRGVGGPSSSAVDKV